MNEESDSNTPSNARDRGLQRPSIEFATSPRTRLGSYAKFIRPMSSQLIRATEAISSNDKKHIRTEAASALYKVGELFETERALLSKNDLTKMHQHVDSLFHSNIEPHSLQSASNLFREFLFKIESTQPSSLSLDEMRALCKDPQNKKELVELAIVRVARSGRKASLALLAAQAQLAIAHLEFLSADAKEIAKIRPDVITQDMLDKVLEVDEGLRSRVIDKKEYRKYGKTLRDVLDPLFKYADEITSRRSREASRQN